VSEAPLRRALRIAGFVGITAAMLPAYALRDTLTMRASKDPVRDRWLRRWSGALLRLFDIHVVLVGQVPAARSGHGRLVVSNHRSAIDIAILLNTFGGHMVSRADLAGWPLVGAAARRVGTVFVDRASTVSGATAIRAMRSLLEQGRTVLVFPEGTTFPDDEVRPFHGGAFIAALHTRAEIVPVGIAYERGSGAAFVGESFPAHLRRMSAAPATRVVVSVGEPVEVQDAARAAELASRAQRGVAELVTRARAACDALG
jgi:1-acyl-sn-glycerol-3-phosphate acyltransferase